jgi:hypothetical protein
MIVAGVTAGAYPLLRLRHRETLFDRRASADRPLLWRSRFIDFGWSMASGLLFALFFHYI